MSETGRLDGVACDKVFTHWLEFQLTDNQGKPLGGLPYTLKSWDGIVKASGVTDGQGILKEENLPPKPMILHVDGQKLAEQLVEKSPSEVIETPKGTGAYHQLVPGDISDATPDVKGWTQDALLASRYYPDPGYPGFIARPGHNRRHVLEIARIAKPVFAKSCLQPAGCTDAGTETEPHTNFGEMQVIEPAYGMVPLSPQMLVRMGGTRILTALGAKAGSAMNRGNELETEEIIRILISKSSQSQQNNVGVFRSAPATSSYFAMQTFLTTAGVMLRNLWGDSDKDKDLLSPESLKEIADAKGTVETRVRYRFVENAQTGQLTAVGYHTAENAGMEKVKVRHVQYNESLNRYEFREDGASSPALVWYADALTGELSQSDLNQSVPQNSTVNAKVAVLDPQATGQTPGLPIPEERGWRDGAYVNPQQDPNEIGGNSTTTPIPDAREHGPTKLTTPAPQEKDFRDYILIFPVSNIPAIYVYLSNSYGDNDSHITSAITDDIVRHASKGDWTEATDMPPKIRKTFPNGRLKSGGHGQSAIQELESRGITYNVEHTYPNGVRVGNVPSHPSKLKKTGIGQSWFPEDWTDVDIKNAGKEILNSSNSVTTDMASGGTMTSGTHNGVFIRVILDPEGGGSIFPDNKIQP